jgi:hypothetical protein
MFVSFIYSLFSQDKLYSVKPSVLFYLRHNPCEYNSHDAQNYTEVKSDPKYLVPIFIKCVLCVLVLTSVYWRYKSINTKLI